MHRAYAGLRCTIEQPDFVRSHRHPQPKVMTREQGLPSAKGKIRRTEVRTTLIQLCAAHRDASSFAGHLAFTKTSLYKLTLPLAPPRSSSSSEPSASRSSDPEESSADGSSSPSDSYDALGPTGKNTNTSWEQRVEERDKEKESRSLSSASSSSPTSIAHDPYFDITGNVDEPCLEEDLPSPLLTTPTAPQSEFVVFLLHSSQPLSYIESLIRAEPFRISSSSDKNENTNTNGARGMDVPITFHSKLNDGKRWSPSTGIGDFLRDAARKGSFIIRIGHRSNSPSGPSQRPHKEDTPSRCIYVNVPSFEARTRFLRRELFAVTDEIEQASAIKAECDGEAKVKTQRVAGAGAGVLGVWWVTVGYLTFRECSTLFFICTLHRS